MKGSVMDIPFIIVGITLFAVSVIIGTVILTEVDNVWPYAGQSKDTLTAGLQTTYLFDYMIAFLAVGMSLFSIISAFFVRSHPILFVFSFIGLSIMILISAVFTNVMDAFLTSESIITVANSFPITVVLVRSFPLFSLIVGIIIMIAQFSKGDEGAYGY